MAGIYHPNTRPGSRLPHAWLAKEGQRVGTHDLLRPGRFTLLCDRALWHEAAGRAARAFDIAIDAMVIDEAGALQDPQGMWMRLREVGPGGAILVRPDAHVAWRSMTLPVDPSAALIGALQAVLGRGPVI